MDCYSPEAAIAVVDPVIVPEVIVIVFVAAAPVAVLDGDVDVGPAEDAHVACVGRVTPALYGGNSVSYCAEMHPEGYEQGGTRELTFDRAIAQIEQLLNTVSAIFPREREYGRRTILVCLRAPFRNAAGESCDPVFALAYTGEINSVAARGAEGVADAGSLFLLLARFRPIPRSRRMKKHAQRIPAVWIDPGRLRARRSRRGEQL